jgi:hypothetical protein
MANEIAQWALLAFTLFLVLGLFRQVSILTPQARRAAPSGVDLGKRLPRPLMDQVAGVTPGIEDEGATIAFITEDCIGCQRLLAELPDALEDVWPPPVLVARVPSQQFKLALQELSVPMIYDDTGELWSSSHVSATPLVVRVDATGKVIRKEVTHDVRRVAHASS